MRIPFATTVLLVALPGCMTSTLNETTSQQISVQGSSVADGWQKNERFIPEPPKVPYLPIQLSASRKGTSPSGFTYTYYGDGSGEVKANPSDTLSGWDIDCSKDAMTDKRNCKVTSYSVDLVIRFTSAFKPKWICILDHDFPGRTGAVRLDNAAPITTDTDGCIGGSYLEPIKKSSEVTLRFVKWPYDYNVDRKNSLVGLRDALELAEFINNYIDKIAFAP